MAEVRVRNLDDWVVEELRARAERQGSRLEPWLRELLAREARRPKAELAEELTRMKGELRQKYGAFSDSTALIREDRDSRG